MSCTGSSYKVWESILCWNSTPAKSNYFLHIFEISVYFGFQKIYAWKKCNISKSTKSLKAKIWQKFREYSKNNWILRGSKLSKESIYTHFMIPRHDPSLILGPLLKIEFWAKKRNTQISLSTELPVELSRGNRLEIYKDEIFRHPTH